MEKPFVTFIPAKHMGVSNLTGKRLEKVKQSAISDHLLQCNYAIILDNFDILTAESNKFKYGRVI